MAASLGERGEVSASDDWSDAPAAKEIIVTMLLEVLGVTSPHSFQITAIFLLAFMFSTVLLIQKTGAGKSMVVLGSAALLRGVIIVIEPLVAVGSDRARAATQKSSWIKSHHVDGLDDNNRSLLVKLLMSLTRKNQGPIILYLSAHDMMPGSCCVEPVTRLFMLGLVTLLVFDEIHMIQADGREFRPEFAELKANLLGLVKLSPPGFRVAQLHMTATMPDDALKCYQAMLGVEFGHRVYGDIARRDISLFAEVCTQPTRAVNAVVKRHLRQPDRKIIVYTNSQDMANGPLLRSMRGVIASADGLTGDVMAVTGKSGTILKAYVTAAFSSSVPSPALDLRVVTATKSFGCGINSQYCGACVHHGIPENINALTQILGRSGRTKLAEGHIPNEFQIFRTWRL